MTTGKPTTTPKAPQGPPNSYSTCCGVLEALFRRVLLPLLSDCVPPSLATLALLPARLREGAGVRAAALREVVVARGIFF